MILKSNIFHKITVGLHEKKRKGDKAMALKALTHAIILAAGSGRRMKSETTKQRIELMNESVLFRSVRAFCECDDVSYITVVCRSDEVEWAVSQIRGMEKVIAVIPGGESRMESAQIGFLNTPDDADLVAIHDAARCLVTPEIVSKVISAAIEHGAATAGCYFTDTVKALENGYITSTIDRERLFFAHTPQVFSRKLYKEALDSVGPELVTDDNMLIEQIGKTVFPVNTGKYNIKLTSAEDISYAEYLLERRERMEMRIGHGYDVHRLSDGRRLVLGGVEIDYPKGLLGHSDADVLTHAIMDALLGAAALGDIGRRFPDNDNSYKDISSLVLLGKVGDLLRSNGYTIQNIDATLVLQRPKVSPYVDKMIDNIAEILGIERGKVNIKATTEEGLGFSGREEGACAHAVALIKK